MLPIVRRFRIRAGIIAAVVLALAITAVIALEIAMPWPDTVDEVALIAIGVALFATMAGVAIVSVRRALALRRVAARHPGRIVFLGRRQPSLVSDLSVYLESRNISADVADRWLVALIDDRGVSAWSVGGTPTELLLMPWGELGTIEVTDVETGGRGRGVAVDVRPFEIPLVVSVGYSAFGVTASLSRDGVTEVCLLTNDHRVMRRPTATTGTRRGRP